MELARSGLFDGRYAIEDLVETGKLADICESYSRATSLNISLVAMPSGTVFVATSAHGFCESFCAFYSTNEQRCARHCAAVVEDAGEATDPVIWNCDLGLVSGITPVRIDGVHAANILLGPAVPEDLDVDRLRRLADEAGHDVEHCVAALKAVPAVTRESFAHSLDFLSKTSTLLFEQGLSVQRDKEAERHSVLLSAVIDQSPVSMVIADAEGVIRYENQAARNLFSLHGDRDIGRKVSDLTWDWELYTLDDTPIAPNDSALARTLRGLATHERKQKLIATDGAVRFLTTEGVPIRDGDGSLIAGFVITQDVTERITAEERLRENEERLEFALSGANEGVWDWNLETDVVRFDSRYFTMAGYEPDAFPHEFCEWEQRVHPADLNGARAAISSYLGGDSDTYDVEFRLQRADGSYMWIRSRGHVVSHTAQGQPLRFVGTHSDLTELKRNEEERARLTSVLEATSDFVSMASPDLRLVYLNSAGRKMIGWGADEDISERKIDTAHPEWVLDLVRNEGVAGAIREGIWEGETALRHVDGTEIPVSQVIITHRNFEGEIDYFSTIIRDISERKQAVHALREHQQLLSSVLESMQEGVLVMDADYRYTYWNRSMEEMSHTPRQEVLGTIPWEKFPFLQGNIADAIRSALTGKVSRDIELEYSLEDGTTGWTRESYFPLLDTAGDIIGVVGIVQDVTARKRSDQELNQLRNYLTNIIDSMPSVLVGVDADGKVTQWNKGAESATGVEAKNAQGRTLVDVFPALASDMEAIAESIQKREAKNEQKRPRQSGDRTRYEDVTIYPLVSNGVEGAVIRIDDVTDTVRLEEMMIQSEKMLSVGGLAAGMAHEINNPLAGMMQTASVMSDRLTNLDLQANRKAAEDAGISMEALSAFMKARGIPRMLDRITASGKRAAEIVTNMLSFARRSDSSFSLQNLAELLDSTVELAGSDYDMKRRLDFRRIEIVREYEADVPFVSCESGKIQQVFLNILRNGAEAMQLDAPKSDTDASDEGLESRFILRLAHEKDAGRIRIEIEDNGPGMDEGTRKRIFEPFFTTKPIDRGTGLGLSVSYFIIAENHGGELTVESTPAKGTNFVIRLPVKGVSAT